MPKPLSNGSDDGVILPADYKAFKRAIETHLVQLHNFGSLSAGKRLPLQRPDWGQSGLGLSHNYHISGTNFAGV
ncbi:hypothetical protein BN14_12062 [Rhizoctonia solani AG-1 IB]|uniref:Uncharacterized protein n=1 Tax=Thanatephorus cucumeris (strain AG1-IB / isolate 7/3/14) TaxID=1108050 RepID=M5CHI0_THACB|nr:hypothetical protein BN14_12062 [Rhizoctonia solani AG-1 IB]